RVEDVVALDVALDCRALVRDARRGLLGVFAAPDLVQDRLEVRRVLRERIGLGPAATDLVDLPVGLALLAHGEPRMARDAIHRVTEAAGQQRDRGLVVVGHRQRLLRDDAPGYQDRGEETDDGPRHILLDARPCRSVPKIRGYCGLEPGRSWLSMQFAAMHAAVTAWLCSNVRLCTHGDVSATRAVVHAFMHA